MGQLLQMLDSQDVRTWFDVGLTLDHLRDNRVNDGLGGDFDGDPEAFIDACVDHLGCVGDAVAGAVPLDTDLPEWPDAAKLLGQRLERGSHDYNALVASLWQHTTVLARALAQAVRDHALEGLIVDDVWAAAQRVPLAVALALVSEHLRLPVVAVRRSPWWRDPDAVGANRHLGEVYAVMETCVPWDAPWVVHVPADAADRQWLIGSAGINPARLVDTAEPRTALQPVAAWAAGLGTRALVVAALDAHHAVTRDDATFHAVACASSRHYLPGLTELEYMIKLNSLIDPNAFRAEENELRGRVYAHAQAAALAGGLDPANTHRLFAATEALFGYHHGADDLVVDHSLSYRHRHRRHYPWRKLTECEVTGVVGAMARALQPTPPARADYSAGALATTAPVDVAAAVAAIVRAPLGIDQAARLAAALAGGDPLIWLPNSDDDSTFADECALFAAFATGPVTLLVSAHWGRGGVHAGQARQAIAAHPVLAGWLAQGRLRLIVTDTVATGTHLMQLGDSAGAAMAECIAQGATVISIGYANLLTLDLLAAPSVRIGRCDGPLAAAFMDLDQDDGYCLWVPPGLRPSLAYPTPIQTPRVFADALTGPLFARACERLGEDAVLARLADDAEQAGTPVAEVLAALADDGDAAADIGVTHSLLTGVHANGAPWSGAYAQLAVADGWAFHTVFAATRSDTVLDLIDAFVAVGGKRPQLAWNGGYMLNAELVGKLGLSEDYIGSPLGLLIENGRVRSLPLFNKPALAFGRNGDIAIREANLVDGLTVSVAGGGSLTLGPEDRNQCDAHRPAYFDLLADDAHIDLRQRVAYRFAGDRIISVHADVASLEVLPVGLTVVVPADQQPAGWVAGAQVRYALPGWADVANAIEAGPMLVRDHRESIEMDAGGWTRQASIRTQAARLDYTHMRGPKIGVGVTADGELIVVAINGRIRESVGATHGELAAILLERGSRTAMGFDPGGSVTLVVDGRQRNISPYNRDYIDHPWSLPPQPRFVGNAILAVRGSDADV